MKLKFIRILSVLLSCLMLIAVVSACGAAKGGDASANTQPGSSSAANTDANQNNEPQSKFPIVDKPITLTLWTYMEEAPAATMKNYNEINCFKEIEKRTGIHIDFIHPADASGDDQFALMVASHDLPDLIFKDWKNVNGGIAKLIQDDVIIDLKEQINQNAPYYKKFLIEHPDCYKEIVTPENNIPYFGMFTTAPNQRIWYGPMIRKDWLDKLGLAIPETTDEWYDVLKAFKERDPNGNETADEIPYSGINGNMPFYTVMLGYGVTDSFHQVDGKVKYSVLEPEFKKYIEFTAKCYKEKLIDPDVFVNDTTAYEAKVTSNKVGLIENWLSRLTIYGDAISKDVPTCDLIGIPYPSMTKGKKAEMTSYFDNNVAGWGIAITSKNKYVAESVKWLDFFFSDEGRYLVKFGIEGEDYTRKGDKIILNDKIMNNPEGLTFDQSISQRALLRVRWIGDSPPEYSDYMALTQKPIDCMKAWADGVSQARRMPPITPTAEDAERMNTLLGDIKTYQDEMITKFIMGIEPMDNYDKFINKLKEMNVDELISLQQKTFDAYNSKNSEFK